MSNRPGTRTTSRSTTQGCPGGTAGHARRRSPAHPSSSRQVDGSVSGSAFPLRMMSRRQQTSAKALCCLARIDVPAQTAATLQDGSGGPRRGNRALTKARLWTSPNRVLNRPCCLCCVVVFGHRKKRVSDSMIDLRLFFVLQRHCDLSVDRPILTQNIDHVKHLSPCKPRDT